VNTSSTRVELSWDVANSSVVSDEQRARLTTKLRSRMTTAGVIRVVASDRRSQSQNRAAAEERLADAVRRALVVPRKRRATKPTRASKEKRLDSKRRRSDRKKGRRGDFGE
jgi:ribosome-associated protein